MAEAARDPAKEHAVLSKILRVSLAPPSPGLTDLAGELEAEGVGSQIRTEFVERIFLAKLATMPLVAERTKYLIECWRGCQDVIGDARAGPVVHQMPAVQQMIGNYAGLSIGCAPLFGLEEVPADVGASTLKAFWEGRELPFAFLVKLAEAVDDQAAELVGPLLTEVCMRMKDRNMNNQRMEELGFITSLCDKKKGGSPVLARLLVTLPVFKPAPNPNAQMPLVMPGAPAGSQAEKPGEGFRLQTQSLLGWVLAPTCIDTAMLMEQSARRMHFQNLARKTQSAVTQAQSLIRHTHGDVMQQALNLVNPLLRTDESTREAVLLWFGDLITGTECRTKSVNTLDHGGGPNHFVDMLENSHTTLDNVLAMQAFQARMKGFATPGMALNCLWCLFELVAPIKLPQVGTLDPMYVLREGAPHAAILGGFASEARFGDAEEVEAAKEYAQSSGLLAQPVKFTSQVFWLALRAMHVLLVPVLKEELCLALSAGYFQNKNMANFEAALGEHFCHQTILQGSGFLMGLVSLLNLEMAFCLCAAFPERSAEIVSGKVTGSILTDDVSPQWNVLPSCILEDLVETLEYFINIRPPGQPASDLFSFINPEYLLLLVTFMLGSGNHVKNPNLRGKATTILMNLMKQHTFAHQLESSPVLANDIIPGCIRVFTAVEKTKQSYYDIRMQLKYQLRIPIMELIEMVLPMEAHKKSLKAFAVEHSEEFLKFLNQMMNDATMQISEGLDTLQEIRRLVREGGEAALTRPDASTVADDEQNAEGGDVYSRSRADPKEHCKTYMKMGHRTIRTLWSISKEAPEIIVGKLNVLQQMVQSCLNSSLDRLVGPRCLELKMQKGQVNDFDEYNFKPKELLQMIAEMYIFVSRADKERVQKMITEDGRSYRPKTFQRAVQILKREQMISQALLKDFEQFVQELNNLAASQEAAMANITVPDHYLDPIMSEIMEDPVMLPTSKTVMDRKVIERHIMSNDDDPFNRMPLKVTDLEPQHELKAEIQEFCTRHGIALGGSED